MDDQSAQSSSATTQDTIANFIDTLIKDKGFTDISEEVRDDIRKDLSTRVDDFMAARIIDALSDENVKTFEEMLKSQKSEEEVQKFVSEHIPDFVDFITSVLMEFRNVYLGITEAPRIIEETPSA